MSANETIQMEFKIADNSLAKLQEIMSGKGSAGGATKGTNALASVMEKFSLGTTAKLAGIAIGVTVITGEVGRISKMLVQSSPMLQSMLKLLNTGIMMMLRPIGDFIGFLLRPLMIYLMRSVFLPWYRSMAPIMRVWGSTLGAGLVAFIKDPLGTLSTAMADVTWTDVATTVFNVFKDWTAIGQILNALGLFDIDLGEISSGISTKVSAFFDSISTTLTSWWDGTMGKLDSFKEVLGGGLDTLVTGLSTAWSTLSVFFTGALGNVGVLLGSGWEAFTSWISDTLGGVGNSLDTAWNNFISFFDSLGLVWTLVGKAWEEFLTFITNLNPMNWADGILDAGQNFIESITNNNKSEQKVDLTINGGSSSGFGEDAIEGLKQLVFGWMEDNDTRR